MSNDETTWDTHTTLPIQGGTIAKIEPGSEYNGGPIDRIRFTMADGKVWMMMHEQDCCEFVRLEEFIGDPADLIGSPLVLAESRSRGNGLDVGPSQTWTFYELSTVRGSVTLRWLGESNGYYSEDVYLLDIESFTRPPGFYASDWP